MGGFPAERRGRAGWQGWQAWQAWQACAASCVWLVLDPGMGGLGWVGRWPEGGQGLDLILKVTGSGKDFNREWELVRSGILEAAAWPCVRVGAGGLPGGVGGSFRSGPGPAFPLSPRARVSSPGPSQILLGAPVPSPEMLAE